MASAAAASYYYQLVTKHALGTPLTYAATSNTLLYKRVVVDVRGHEAVALVIALLSSTAGELAALLRKGVAIKGIKRVLDAVPLLTAADVAFCEWLRRYYAALYSEAYTLFVALPTALLKQQALAESDSENTTPVRVSPDGVATALAAEAAPTLNSEQVRVVTALKPKLNTFGLFLIKGVTGSGKSYVYVALARSMALCSKQTLLLVPEISLVFQLAKLFKQYFPASSFALFHSKLSVKERAATLAALQVGSIAVIIGTRSALFLPQQRRLGLIIIDEEHEPAYKNGSAPRYHARQVAQQLAKLRGVPLLLGSATPSVETYYAAQRGIIELHVLKQRYGKLELPRLNFNQTRLPPQRSPAFVGSSARQAPLTTAPPQPVIFSQAALQALQRVMAERGQALVYVNKRGFSATPLCTACGVLSQMSQLQYFVDLS